MSVCLKEKRKRYKALNKKKTDKKLRERVGEWKICRVYRN